MRLSLTQDTAPERIQPRQFVIAPDQGRRATRAILGEHHNGQRFPDPYGALFSFRIDRPKLVVVNGSACAKVGLLPNQHAAAYGRSDDAVRRIHDIAKDRVVAMFWRP